jgi:hypothetical protein
MTAMITVMATMICTVRRAIDTAARACPNVYPSMKTMLYCNRAMLATYTKKVLAGKPMIPAVAKIAGPRPQQNLPTEIIRHA